MTAYVLLTAAKDEEGCIAEVIERVLRQTVLPVAWIVIDDGSSDRTAAIVSDHASRHPFIRLHGSGTRDGRNFGSQYKALRAAYELARPLSFDLVAVQDADQAPGSPDYYERLLEAFAQDWTLGVASGMVYERAGGQWQYRASNARDATAGSAVFRRACFEQIGGYSPLVHGGSDWLAQIDARMKGWTVRTLESLRILHYRPSSSAGGMWHGRFREGQMDASFGSHAGFELLKCARRALSRPYLLGALVRFCGYLWWRLSGRPPVLAPDQVAYLRREQAARLRVWRTTAKRKPSMH